MNNFD